MSKSVGILYKASFCLSKCSLLTLYYSLIYPYFQYCISVWGSTYPSNLDRLLLLQKRSVRTISGQPFLAHTDPIFKDLETVKFNNIYLLHFGKFLYQFKVGLLPQTFNNMFCYNVKIHSYNTRNASLFHIPKCRTNIKKFALRHQGPKFFNSLNKNIQASISLSSLLSNLEP